jgi:hypothetical protein
MQRELPPTGCQRSSDALRWLCIARRRNVTRSEQPSRDLRSECRVLLTILQFAASRYSLSEEFLP